MLRQKTKNKRRPQFLGPLFAVTPFLQESKSLHLHFGIRGTTTVINAVVM